MKLSHFVPLFVLLAVGNTNFGVVRAGGFEKFDFSLRFPAALSRFATYADVAGMGGASAASKWQSAINPASIAWQPMPEGTSVSVSPQYSTVDFNQGNRLHVFAESLTIDAGRAGRFLLTAAQIRSNEAVDKFGFTYGFDSDLAQLAWGLRFGDAWAAGINLNYSRSKTDFSVGATPDSHTDDETFGLRFGVLHRVTKNLGLGIVADYAVTPSDTTVFAGNVKSDDVTHQFLLRPGIAYEYAPDSTVYLDYQFGRFSNDTGVLVVNRFYTGAEQRIYDWLFLRAGVAVDTRANAAFTAGIGLYPVDWASIDLGFQERFFPELESDFGRSRTFAISASISF